ncbi:MAG: histidine kinase dimerization/phospho-acceptor domain-containing protein [Pusillimonas sp.]
MKPERIRRFLLWGIGSTIMALMAVVGVTTYFSTQHEVDELFDAELAQYARLINRLLVEANTVSLGEQFVIPLPDDVAIENEASMITGTPPFMADMVHKYERKIAFQVWRSDGTLLLRSESAPAQPIAAKVSGFGNMVVADNRWTTFALFNARLDAWVLTAQHNDVRDELSLYLALGQSGPLALSLIPMLLLVWWVVRRAMASIATLSSTLGAIDPAHARTVSLDLPEELRPVQEAVNRLLEAQHQYISREKRFIADVSHELRTPLSILAVHSKNLDQARQRSDVDAAARAIRQGVRRLSYLVSQLMELEKLEQVRKLHASSLDLAELVQASLAQVSPGLLERVDWVLDIPAGIIVRVDHGLFQVALRNVLDNACKYAADQSTVTVRFTSGGLFEVSNIVVPGHEPDIRRLGERFFRHPAHAAIEGSGLGLTLLARIFHLHQLNPCYRFVPPGLFVVQTDLSPVLERVSREGRESDMLKTD